MSEENTKVEAATPAPTSDAPATEPAPKKKGKRWPIVVGIVAVVAVVAGAGFWVWHEQPSFCNAICHTPQDGYLETYEAEPGQVAMDKWGNEVADAHGMLSSVHRAGAADATCMSCHIPSIGQQVSEGLAWASGNYEVGKTSMGTFVPLERDLDTLVATRGLSSGDEFCLNESCHNLTRDDLVQATSNLAFNPHVAQHGEAECSDCHKAHRASVVTCTQCHEEAEVPQGWLSYSQEQLLETNYA